MNQMASNPSTGKPQAKPGNPPTKPNMPNQGKPNPGKPGDKPKGK